jgi:hypothetical protein
MKETIILGVPKTKLLFAVLCCAVLCCAVLCCAVLCCAVLCCARLMIKTFFFQQESGMTFVTQWTRSETSFKPVNPNSKRVIAEFFAPVATGVFLQKSCQALPLRR